MKCISLIGMPGSGKSTIGRILAKDLDWAFLDTDLLIESLYARPLQKITEELPTELFRDVEGEIICSIQAADCVIATGGSAIYRPEAIRHLKSLGRLAYLNAPFTTLQERISLKPDRGISFAPGQTLEDIYAERQALYLTSADLVCDTNTFDARECARWIAEQCMTGAAKPR